MTYVVFHISNPHAYKRLFKTAAGAKRATTCANRNAGRTAYDFIEETLFYIKYPIGTKLVKNLISGQDVAISEDTPRCCDPSSETYWCI